MRYKSFPKTYGLEVGTWPNGQSPASLTSNPSTADGKHKLWNNVNILDFQSPLDHQGLVMSLSQGLTVIIFSGLICKTGIAKGPVSKSP